MCRAGRNRPGAVPNPLTVDLDRPLLDHTKRFRRAADETHRFEQVRNAELTVDARKGYLGDVVGYRTLLKTRDKLGFCPLGRRLIVKPCDNLAGQVNLTSRGLAPSSTDFLSRLISLSGRKLSTS